ncbi:hypothetical protein Igag_0560 [Ignisphaera aggregans DSM 17230]|uniref:Uncharacterized protein n=1 Tax=Ignisphaera aggregans (strain DSM 17230 / JCM 13409 / AQ1.S1) TaxID=583356 RepID=E0SSC4_IGNAA|nr:hypothetical protein Igag_0560 [Ignisphaera aggregans DSM 17230]
MVGDGVGREKNSFPFTAITNTSPDTLHLHFNINHNAIDLNFIRVVRSIIY